MWSRQHSRSKDSLIRETELELANQTDEKESSENVPFSSTI